MKRKTRYAMRFLAALALASAGGAPRAFAVVRLPEAFARDSLGRDTGYVLRAHESGRFVGTSLPGDAGRDTSTARPQGGSRAFACAYDHRGRMVRKDIQHGGTENSIHLGTKRGQTRMISDGALLKLKNAGLGRDYEMNGKFTIERGIKCCAF